jgi:hypothetical protein
MKWRNKYKPRALLHARIHVSTNDDHKCRINRPIYLSYTNEVLQRYYPGVEACYIPPPRPFPPTWNWYRDDRGISMSGH